jgi:hypothetical protein
VKEIVFSSADSVVVIPEKKFKFNLINLKSAKLTEIYEIQNVCFFIFFSTTSARSFSLRLTCNELRLSRLRNGGKEHVGLHVKCGVFYYQILTHIWIRQQWLNSPVLNFMQIHLGYLKFLLAYRRAVDRANGETDQQIWIGASGWSKLNLNERKRVIPLLSNKIMPCNIPFFWDMTPRHWVVGSNFSRQRTRLISLRVEMSSENAVPIS